MKTKLTAKQIIERVSALVILLAFPATIAVTAASSGHYIDPLPPIMSQPPVEVTNPPVAPATTKPTPATTPISLPTPTVSPEPKPTVTPSTPAITPTTSAPEPVCDDNSPEPENHCSGDWGGNSNPYDAFMWCSLPANAATYTAEWSLLAQAYSPNDFTSSYACELSVYESFYGVTGALQIISPNAPTLPTPAR